MCQYDRNWRAMCADKAKTQVGRRPEYELPPSLANMCEFVPPLLAIPYPPSHEKLIIILVSVKDGWSIEIKDVKKRIIVEYVDRRSIWTVARGSCSLTQISATGGGVPGLATRCTLAILSTD